MRSKCTNNKSRPERLFVFDAGCKNKRRHSNWKQKATKYVTGEYIFDTKGQMAQIKYIGACHKGSGTWYGIEFVDGSLGKHNGSIHGNVYFDGAERRCDMIRANKIRNRASPNINYKGRALSRTRHKRAVSDIHVSNCRSREEKVVYRQYMKHKPKPRLPAMHMKRVKKEKYKGNKYILAMEEETEKRKHERIGSIKMDKKRIKEKKHQRNSSKVQQILKRKELKKEEISKLNQENRLRELKRIQAAKQKSRARVNRTRSQSDDTNAKVTKTCHPLYDYSLKSRKCTRDDTMPVDSDSALILQELSDQVPIHTVTSLDYKHNRLQSDIDDAATDYWIKRLAHTQRSENGIGNQSNILQKAEALSMSKSVSLLHDKTNCPQDDTYYGIGIMPRKKVLKRSLSLSTLRRADTAPIVTNDDKGTDYWIQQYNKKNKKKSDSKHKSKSKSKQKLSSNQRINDTTSRLKQSKQCVLSIKNPNICDKLQLDARPQDISPPNAFIRDDSSDVASSIFSDPSPSIVSLESITIGSAVSSSLSISPSNSDQSLSTSSPNASNDALPTDFNDDTDMNKTSSHAKYGGYPFQRKREQYINRKFTGIVRIGHRYLLRDGRVGVVRFINTTHFSRGTTWIGVELDTAEGEHNGTVHNIKYFECASMYGTFVKKSQIAQYIHRDTTKSLSMHQLKYLNASK